MSIEALVMQLTRTDNLSAHRFFGMGFALGPFQIVPVEHMTAATGFVAHPLVRVPFRCVCGRVEMFGGYVPEAQHQFNIFRQLESIGSLSRKHLLEDGYSDAQVDAMERKLDDYMLAVGFELRRPETYAYQWKDPPLRYALPEGDPGWVWRTDRVPPVPGVAEDFAVRNMREGTYTRLPQRPKPLEWRKGAWDEVSGSVLDPSVQRVSRPVRVGAALDSEE